MLSLIKTLILVPFASLVLKTNGGSKLLRLETIEDRRVKFAIDIYTQQCTGEVSGVGLIDTNGVLVWKDPTGCTELEIKWLDGSRVEVKETAMSCFDLHGISCTFEGVYTKL